MIQGMTGLDWVFALFVLVFLVIFIDATHGFNGSARFFRWLKGSINYHLNRKAMLDRIAELEKDLQDANKRRLEWRAAVTAIFQVIDADKQKYRSKAAGNIRECLASLVDQGQFLGEPEPTKVMISVWKEIFENTIKPRN